MNLEREAVRQVYNRVHEQTEAVRNGGAASASLLAFFDRQGLDIQRCVFPGLVACDEGIYTGTVVSQDRRVFEFYFDENDTADYEFNDVTDELGPKDPAHAQADCLEIITMSLMYFDEAQRKAAS